MKILITRLEETDKETLGLLQVFDGLKKLFECKTLELPYKNNRTSISCIPIGRYVVSKRWSSAHGDHYILLGVDGRSYILIHSGNFFFDTEGCILVGKEYADINSDDELDVSSSRQTVSNLNAVLGKANNIEAHIINV